MRLRESTVFFRFATHTDLVDSGAVHRLFEELRVRGFVPQTWRDEKEIRGPVRDWNAHAEATLALLEGAGFHQQVQLHIDASEGPVRSLQITAGAHPYAGDWLTLVDVRLDAAVLEDAAVAAAWRDWWQTWLVEATPLWAAAHDTDDQGMQNCTLPALLRSGWGLTAWDWEPGQAPGREVSRGTLRMAPNWLTYLGPVALERLGLVDDALTNLEAPLPQTVGDGLLWQLGETPAWCATEVGRQTQQRVREMLGFDRLAAAERWTQGYWQRR